MLNATQEIRFPVSAAFAEHMACDVKQLIEDQETGAKSFRYVRTGTDHYSLAFTYDCIAWSQDTPGPVYVGPAPYDEEKNLQSWRRLWVACRRSIQ